MSTYIPAISGVLLLSLLTACGGDGGGSGGTPPGGGQSIGPVVLAGRFVDRPVEGLRYTTPTRNGKTDANGTFVYQTGETVSFHVGDILIGQAAGAATVTPLTLAGAPAPVSLLETNLAVRTVNLNKQAGSGRAAPLDIATNIALFLQTLDEDGDLTNGIKIPAAMANLAAGASLNFARPMAEFHADAAFRKVIAAGRGAGLWNGSRAIKQPLLALDALYAGLDLSPAIAAVGQLDQNTAGVNAGSRIIYGLDSQGNRATEQTDIGVNQTIELFTNRLFDINGNLLAETNDVNFNNSIDSSITNVYDTNGNLLSTTRVGSLAYTYDADGNLISIRRDSTETIITMFTYDSNGLLTRKEEDVSGDQTINLRTVYTYDLSGNLITVETDGNATGAPDATVNSRVRYSYDQNGRKISEENDIDADGVINLRTTFIYDNNGNLATIEADGKTDGTANADATRVALTNFTYDANHHLLAEQRVTNGALDRSVTYHYDASGNQSLIESDDNGDGIVDRRESFTYDDAGTVTRVQRASGNGAVQTRLNYTSSVMGKWNTAGWR